jgi:hypothetical protein
MAPPKLRFELTREGAETVAVDGVALHSRYDPVREADRLVRRQLGASAAGVIVILGPGLGYAAAAVRQVRPLARIITVAFDAALAIRAAQRLTALECHSWAPGPGDLTSFLRREIDELDLDNIAVVAAPVAARIFPVAYAAATAALRTVLGEQRGTLVTTAAFGRRWIRNAIRNSLTLEKVTSLSPSGRPIVVAASGPSLEGLLADLRSAREQYELWALPSAVPALTQAGVSPDIIIVTDAGYYGAAHLFHRGTATPIAMPLSAAPVPSLDGIATPVSLFGEGHPFEAPLFAALGQRLPVVPSAGTVAASALRLALQLQAQTIFLVGLDLCFRDLQGHARPNVAASLLSATSSRTRPFPALLYDHAQAIAPRRQIHGGVLVRRSTALDTYAGWFASFAAPPATTTAPRARPDIVRVEPTAVATPALRSVGREQLRSELRALAATNQELPPRPQPGPQPSAWPGRATRRAAIVRLLADWSSALDAAAADPPDRLPHAIARHLVHYAAPVELMRVVAARRQKQPDWDRKWHELLQGCKGFVDNLAWRVRRAD